VGNYLPTRRISQVLRRELNFSNYKIANILQFESLERLIYSPTACKIPLLRAISSIGDNAEAELKTLVLCHAMILGLFV
jgi:hypothetical protein